ncbi:hypothetical protein CAPTEDRAFT_219329 [Capitella teleta]|uniref:Uncharacterized protein n=1 Tax=Capitella teleta TaxID=283909 RepID=R7UAB4_CAPTE|nr:hypothetical protein CAPTEDRAFT_219329 [Capitella teleta]|eukprot:ELU03056.1 hypothetical protein CAPTEDRAFT_219329 [Capitella teleta]
MASAEKQQESGPLLRAAYEGDVDRVKELLLAGVPVDIANQAGLQAIHFAAKTGNVDLASELLRQGASINVPSHDVFTPLYMAAQIGHLEIVMLLLAQGSDPTTKTQNGSTAKDVAYQQGYQAVAELLEEYERRLIQRSRENSVEDEAEKSPKPTNGVKSKICPKNPSYQEVIPSPKHSPLKTKPTNGVEK